MLPRTQHFTLVINLLYIRHPLLNMCAEMRIVMEKVDLHVHSTYSDGTKTPKELIEIAEKEGLSAIALTDHDTLDGIPAALAASDKSPVELIPGVELSTNFDRTEVHIVGLFLDYTNNEINNYLARQRQSRIDRNIQMCQKFCDIGINITYDKMCELYPDAVITRAHFADYLVKNKYTGDRNEAFDRYLSPGKPCYVSRHKVDPKDAVNIIHAAHGVAVLAHPVLYHLGKEQMNALLDNVCSAGIDGIEAIYSTYKPADERYIRTLAKEHNLLISGGSDYHGDNKPHIQLGRGMGHLFVPSEVLDNLRKRSLSYR